MVHTCRGEHAVVGPPDDVVVRAVRGNGHNRLAVVVRVAVDADRQRRLPLHERAVDVEAESAVLLVSKRRRKRVRRVERLVAEAEVGHPAPAIHARLGDDVDAEAPASLVVVCGVGVHAEPDRLDLRLRRQPPPAEPVDPHGRTGSCHLHQDLLELVGIIGQLRDLLVAQRRREGVAGHVGRVGPHDDLLGQPGQWQVHGHRVGALLQRQRPFKRLKSCGLDLDRVRADRQALHARLPPLVHGHDPGRAHLIDEGDRGRDESRTGLIDHGDRQIGLSSRLIVRASGRGGEQQHREQQQESSSHYGGTYEPFFTKDSGLSAGFNLNFSIVHSSVTLPLAPVVMR